MNGAEHNWAFVTAAFAAAWIVLIGYGIRVHTALWRARKEHDAAMENTERHV